MYKQIVASLMPMLGEATATNLLRHYCAPDENVSKRTLHRCQECGYASAEPDNRIPNANVRGGHCKRLLGIAARGENGDRRHTAEPYLRTSPTP